MEVVKTAMTSCARNDVFPIHVNFNDDEADMRTSKPGGYFCKALYSENGSDKGEADHSGGEPESAVKSRKGGTRAAAEAAADRSAEEPGSGAVSGHEDEELDVERELNGGEDAGYHGFCRTER